MRPPANQKLAALSRDSDLILAYLFRSLAAAGLPIGWALWSESLVHANRDDRLSDLQRGFEAGTCALAPSFLPAPAQKALPKVAESLTFVEHPQIVNAALNPHVALATAMKLGERNLSAGFIEIPESIFGFPNTRLQQTSNLLAMPRRCDAQQVTYIAEARLVAGVHSAKCIWAQGVRQLNLRLHPIYEFSEPTDRLSFPTLRGGNGVGYIAVD
jgi:hypothetical protein